VLQSIRKSETFSGSSGARWNLIREGESRVRRCVADQMAKGNRVSLQEEQGRRLHRARKVSVPGMVEIVRGPAKGKFLSRPGARAHRDGLQGAGFSGVEVDGERVNDVARSAP